MTTVRDPVKVKEAKRRWYRRHGKDYYRENRDKRLASNKVHYEQNIVLRREQSCRNRRRRRAEDPAGYMLDNARNSAKRKNREFALSRKWLEAKLTAGVCEVTGIKLNWRHEALVPSLDRIDASKGYTEGNTRVTTWIFNRARGAFSDEEFMEYLIYPFRAEV